MMVSGMRFGTGIRFSNWFLNNPFFPKDLKRPPLWLLSFHIQQELFVSFHFRSPYPRYIIICVFLLIVVCFFNTGAFAPLFLSYCHVFIMFLKVPHTCCEMYSCSKSVSFFLLLRMGVYFPLPFPSGSSLVHRKPFILVCWFCGWHS